MPDANNGLSAILNGGIPKARASSLNKLNLINCFTFASLERFGVQAVIMSGVGHFLMMENPKDFNLLLKKAISKFVQ